MVNNFFYSVLLVLISQIPLVLKLYLDHKGKKDSLKQKLFDKQIEASIRIYRHLTDLHWSQYRQVSVWKGAASEDEWFQNFERELIKGSFDTLHRFTETVVSEEFLLPARIVGALDEYKINAYKILGAAVRSELTAIRSWQELTSLWEKQQELFNALVNAMRMRLGIDVLSDELTKFIEVKGKQLFIQTQLKAD
jgi:hypothetical protein